VTSGTPREDPEEEGVLELDTLTKFEEGEAPVATGDGAEPVAEGSQPSLEEGGPAGDPGELPELPYPPTEGKEGEAIAERGARRLSSEGVAFIARYEGFRSRLYYDAAGHCTIGYGHLVHRGSCNGGEPAEFRAGIGRDRALELLLERAAQFAAAVNRLGVPLDQNQFDALVSFTFNLGPGWIQDSGLQRALEAGNYAVVPREMNRWVYVGGKKLQGLVKRRRAEGELFFRGRTPDAPSVEAPPWAGRPFTQPPPMSGEDVRQWQSQMEKRGWPIDVDGIYGDRSEDVCRSFQREKGLADDGDVGPETWRAAWAVLVT